MPELPEVETIVRDLQKKVLQRTFLDVWTDWPKTIKKPKSFEEFKKELKGKKIKKIWIRAKNIIFELSGSYSLLIHQKMTGHLLVGYWVLDNGYWKPKEKGSLEEKVNNYIHLMFILSRGLMLALSDLRKFAKVELWKTEELLKSPEFKALGPEPLEKGFSFEKFKEIIYSCGRIRVAEGQRPKSRCSRAIKQVLIDQNVIAGIGNIYSDEILWQAKIHPFREVSRLSDEELKKIYQATPKILKKAIKLRGTSISDFRDTAGKKGNFGGVRKVYQRENEKCFRCGEKIKRLKIGGRSAHFCPKCQA